MRYATLALILGLLIGGGAVYLLLRHDHVPHEHPEAEEEKAIQRTVWTDRHEIFLEHPPLAAGEPARFVTHVTDLATLEPRRAGPITFLLGSAELRVDDPIRPGIYVPEIRFPSAGSWNVSIRIDDRTIDLGAFTVHSDKAAADAAPMPEAPEGIAFLKEQQWKLGTKSEPVSRRTLVRRLRVPGVVVARPGSRAELTAPVEGRLLPPSGRALPALGERVEAGQTLGFVQPPFSDFTAKLVEAEADAVRAQVALEQAETTARRLRTLVAEKARSERELADAEFALRTAKADLEAATALRGAYAKSGASFTPEGHPAFEVKSPISGIVIHVGAAAGENVHTERAVFTVLDASRVRLEARISEADVDRLAGSRAALFETPDAPGRFHAAGDGPVYLAPEVDPATRTVALSYDVTNDGGKLRIGMSLVLHVETARAEEAVALPESAIVDEEGRFVAFVQVSGETFEKRDLVVGFRDAGFAQIVSGLKEGERVVTKGAYAVRLASVSTTLPSHGHTH